MPSSKNSTTKSLFRASKRKVKQSPSQLKTSQKSVLKKKRMSTRSAKAKGRKLQTWVAEKLLKLLKRVTELDIKSTPMGVNGADVQLSTVAYKQFPYNIECKNAERMTAFVRYLSNQKINLIISANITSKKYRIWCKKNLKNFIQIYIKARIQSLIKRDYKGLYKKALNKKIKNVVGIDLPFKDPKKIDLILYNDETKNKFLKKTKEVEKFLKQNNVKIY